MPLGRRRGIPPRLYIMHQYLAYPSNMSRRTAQYVPLESVFVERVNASADSTDFGVCPRLIMPFSYSSIQREYTRETYPSPYIDSVSDEPDVRSLVPQSEESLIGSFFEAVIAGESTQRPKF